MANGIQVLEGEIVSCRGNEQFHSATMESMAAEMTARVGAHRLWEESEGRKRCHITRMSYATTTEQLSRRGARRRAHSTST
jgi:hypothetical protein